MGRKVCVELDENGEGSYFRSMEEAAKAIGVNPRDLKAALDTGTYVRGTKVYARTRPWKRLQKDRRFFTICYAIPWNYRCGLDKLAEEMGLTMTGLIRHCVLTTFTEEELWYKATQSEGFVPEKFHNLPQGKKRVWLVSDKRRGRKKKNRLVGGMVRNYALRPGDYWWLKSKEDRDKLITDRERKRLKQLRAVEELIRLRGKELGALKNEINLRRRDGRPATQSDGDRLSSDSGHNARRPGRKKNPHLRKAPSRTVRAIQRRVRRSAGKG